MNPSVGKISIHYETEPDWICGLGAKSQKHIKHIVTTWASHDLLCLVDQSAFDLGIRLNCLRALVPLSKSPQIRGIYVIAFDLLKLKRLEKTTETFSERSYFLVQWNFQCLGFFFLLWENNFHQARMQIFIIFFFFPKTCILIWLWYDVTTIPQGVTW